MKTYIADIIPRIHRFSKKLDDLTLLTNLHWVVLNEHTNQKLVYIFRSNGQMLLAQDGKVLKGKWEHLGNNSLLIESKEGSCLFRHGFFDDNLLALKVDGRNEYLFLVNELKFDDQLNTLDKVVEFLTMEYIELEGHKESKPQPSDEPLFNQMTIFQTDQGSLYLEQHSSFSLPQKGARAFVDAKPAASGKYKFGKMRYCYIRKGQVIGWTFF